MKWLSSTALRAFRAVVGLLALLLAAWFIGRGGRSYAALRLSLLLFGAFTIAHLLLDLFWARLWARSARPQRSEESETARRGRWRWQPPLTRHSSPAEHSEDSGTRDITSAFRETTGVVISTSGVVLGLIAAFSSQVTLPLKVGITSLAIAILVGIVLYNYILYPLPEAAEPNVLIRYLLTIAFFALAFGLLSIAMAIVFKNP
jgi:hypothetical protein